MTILWSFSYNFFVNSMIEKIGKHNQMVLQGGVIKRLHSTRDSRENVALQISVFGEKEREREGVGEEWGWTEVNLKCQPKLVVSSREQNGLVSIYDTAD